MVGERPGPDAIKGKTASDKLQEQIDSDATDISAEQANKFDIGVSQFQKVPSATWTGTSTLERRVDTPLIGVWGQTWDSEMAAKVRQGALSWPQLVLDRALDLVEDSFQKRNTPPSGRQGSGYYFNKLGAPQRHRIVVIGSGWGSHAFVKSLDATNYDVTLVSPRNYFLFTPMLAGAATGTVELRSITESIRAANPDVNYLEATVTEVVPGTKTISCQSVVCQGAECSIDDFDLEYDSLVYGVGAGVNTFGIKGVKDHCFFLKQVNDAARLREAIGNTFERANLPDMSDEERLRTLTFVVVGAGPTGVELTAELKDFVEEDAARFYPHLLPFIRIKVLEASDRVLMQFEEGLQGKAVKDLEKRSSRAEGLLSSLPDDYVTVMLKSSVKEVSATDMTLNDGTVIPYGIAVWAAGIGPLPLTLDLIKNVPEQNADAKARGRLLCDRWMRVAGCPGVIALGDASYVADDPLPATAQVAAQQGAYLARIYNRQYDMMPLIPTKRLGATAETLGGVRFNQGVLAKPFQFLNLGILAYTGNKNALAQVEVSGSKFEIAGLVGW
eukprot:CAMPEP_0179411172 /NCGR_PEP_ID=MMETSP0799-20121207/3752_1 /TAXON_ID=46947 /ORGANISM="Geminigera cryophila, Strain CCMP2564" /LENGTH=556 /DNA_ID=CAMNT_0021183217 /DNA_START=211 /DNA_END=1878 /DNA_ORIENTATION=+